MPSYELRLSVPVYPRLRSFAPLISSSLIIFSHLLSSLFSFPLTRPLLSSIPLPPTPLLSCHLFFLILPSPLLTFLHFLFVFLPFALNLSCLSIPFISFTEILVSIRISHFLLNSSFRLRLLLLFISLLPSHVACPCDVVREEVLSSLLSANEVDSLGQLVARVWQRLNHQHFGRYRRWRVGARLSGGAVWC